MLGNGSGFELKKKTCSLGPVGGLQPAEAGP